MWYIVTHYNVTSPMLCNQFLIYIPNYFLAWYIARWNRNFSHLLLTYFQFQYYHTLLNYVSRYRRQFYNQSQRGAPDRETMHPRQSQRFQCQTENPLRRKPFQNSNKMRSDKTNPSTRMGYFEIEIRPNVVNVPPNLNRFIPYNIPIDGYESDSFESDTTLDEPRFKNSTDQRAPKRKQKKKRRAFISKKGDPDFNPNFPYRSQTVNNQPYSSTSSVNFNNNSTFPKNSSMGCNNQYPGYSNTERN